MSAAWAIIFALVCVWGVAGWFSYLAAEHAADRAQKKADRYLTINLQLQRDLLRGIPRRAKALSLFDSEDAS